MVFKGTVDIPNDGQLDELTGMITRGIRGVFGIPRCMPRKSVYEVVGMPAPDHVLWATAILEFYKSMNSPSDILKHAAWQQWQSPALHQYDRDVVCLKEQVKALEVEFHRVQPVKAEQWELQQPHEAS